MLVCLCACVLVCLLVRARLTKMLMILFLGICVFFLFIFAVENLFYYYSVVFVREYENRDYIDIYSIPHTVVIRLCALYIVFTKTSNLQRVYASLRPENLIDVKYGRDFVKIGRIDARAWQKKIANAVYDEYERTNSASALITGDPSIGKRSVAYIIADMIYQRGRYPTVLDYNSLTETDDILRPNVLDYNSLTGLSGIVHEVWAISRKYPTRYEPVIVLIRNYDKIFDKIDRAVIDILHRVPHVFIIATSNSHCNIPIEYRHFMTHFHAEELPQHLPLFFHKIEYDCGKLLRRLSNDE